MPEGTRSRTALLAAVSRARPVPGGAQLARLCQEIANGLDLPRIGLELTGGPDFRGPESRGLEFRWPVSPSAFEAVGTSRWALRRIPVVLGAEQVAVLSVDAGVLRRMSGKQSQVLAELVDLLGPVLYEARLQRQLDVALDSARENAERIAAARRQAFAERDQERRDLERDLHDGAQHHLVALRMVVGLLELQLANGDRPGVGAGLARLRSGLEQTEQTLLSTAAGICPPVLVDHGLVAALTTEFQEDAGQVRVLAAASTAGRRFPLALETAVYFTCLEAVNNARKHAPGARVTVVLSDHSALTVDSSSPASAGLAFAVMDDGPGLDRQDPVDSFGLGNMRARIVAAGGQLELRTAPGAGTTVEGFIPV